MTAVPSDGAVGALQPRFHLRAYDETGHCIFNVPPSWLPDGWTLMRRTMDAVQMIAEGRAARFEVIEVKP